MERASINCYCDKVFKILWFIKHIFFWNFKNLGILNIIDTGCPAKEYNQKVWDNSNKIFTLVKIFYSLYLEEFID